MKKILTIISVFLILISNINVYANADDLDEITYVWIDETINEAKAQKEKPNILSKSAIVYARNSGQILFGKNENEKVPMASTTKIMTAIVAIESLENRGISYNTEIIVDKQAASINGSRLGLTTGDKITYNDLLYGLMICSRK